MCSGFTGIQCAALRLLRSVVLLRSFFVVRIHPGSVENVHVIYCKSTKTSSYNENTGRSPPNRDLTCDKGSCMFILTYVLEFKNEVELITGIFECKNKIKQSLVFGPCGWNRCRDIH